MKRNINTKKNLIKIFSVFCITLTMLFNSAFIAKAAAAPTATEDTAAEKNKALALDEAKFLIKNYYVGDVPDSTLNLGSIDAMVKALNDPYSQYFTNQQYNDFVGRINNTFCGIGVYINAVSKGLEVTGVIDNSPAQSVGIAKGDIITKANDHPLAGLSSDEAVKYVKGEENTPVALETLRGDITNYLVVKRKQINAPTVLGDILNDKTAYIRISSFGEATPKEFKAQLDELKKSNPDYYIIDLRDNGGGYTSAAYDIAGYFIGKKPVIHITDRYKNTYVVDAKEQSESIDKPTFFLVNENTASASEILSAAVKDYNKAFLIGSNTYGKGCAQNMYQLSDGSSLKITVLNFYSPNGNAIQKVGIAPNLKVKDDVNPLAVSILLAGDSGNSVSKKGYIRVRLSDQYFEINQNLARKNENSDAIKFIIDSCDKNEVYMGTENGWQKAPSEYLNSMDKLLSAN